LAKRIAGIAGTMLEASAADIELVDGSARVKGTDRAIAIARIARLAYQRSNLVVGGPGLRETATYDPDGTFSNACHAAIVEVDIQTGGVTVRRFVVAEDAGILVNPMIVEGQVHGGVAHGIANALFEEIKYDAEGNLLTTSLADYLPPTAAEIPSIEIHHLVTLSDATITRAKGVGEGGTIGAPAAVVN